MQHCGINITNVAILSIQLNRNGIFQFWRTRRMVSKMSNIFKIGRGSSENGPFEIWRSVPKVPYQNWRSVSSRFGENCQKVTWDIVIFAEIVLRAPWADFNDFWTKIQGFSRTFCFWGSKSQNPRQHCQKPVTTQHRNHPKWRKSGSVIGFGSIGVVPARVMHRGR